MQKLSVATNTYPYIYHVLTLQPESHLFANQHVFYKLRSGGGTLYLENDIFVLEKKKQVWKTIPWTKNLSEHFVGNNILKWLFVAFHTAFTCLSERPDNALRPLLPTRAWTSAPAGVQRPLPQTIAIGCRKADGRRLLELAILVSKMILSLTSFFQTKKIPTVLSKPNENLPYHML